MLTVSAVPDRGPMKVGIANHKENMMRRASAWKRIVVGIGGLILGISGGCVPDDFFVKTAGDIVSGLILSGVNIALTNTGLGV